MNRNRQQLIAAYSFIDGVAEEKFKRNLTEDEKALAHSAIHEAFELCKRENIPFATAFEKILPTLPAWEEFETLFQTVREKRGSLERLFSEPSGRQAGSEYNLLPLLRRARRLPTPGPWVGLSLSLIG